MNSQCHSSEDLDQALQAYQAYQVPCSQDSTPIPERTITTIIYHVAQASQAKHGSLVERVPNGGLAGSDVRILSRSSRKCTVTGIDSHELQGIDVVQCEALVESNHGTVNLIMMSMLATVKAPPSIPLDRLSASRTQLMTDLSKLVVNRGSAPLMALPCPWFAEVASCTFLYLANPQMRI